ncbi:aldo/keto reductase [Arthrobacter sp. SA17]
MGINHFDTAQFYSDGFVNRVIGEVAGRHNHVVVATKVGADPDPGARIPLKLAQRPEQLRASVDDNLRSLGLEQLPIVNLRRPDVGPGAPAEGNQIVDLDDQLATMCTLRDEGKIGAIGLSSVTKEGLRRALPAGIVCVQNPYSLAARDDEELVKICLDADIAWVPYFPLGSAFPGMPKVTDQPAVQNAAASVGATPAQIGLAWLLAHAPNVLLIPGTSQTKHLNENVAAGLIELDAHTMATLNDVAA